jgi:hypothetical protein
LLRQSIVPTLSHLTGYAANLRTGLETSYNPAATKSLPGDAGKWALLSTCISQRYPSEPASMPASRLRRCVYMVGESHSAIETDDAANR